MVRPERGLKNRKRLRVRHTSNPAKDDIDAKQGSYFPALVVPACRAPVLVADKQALQHLVLDLERDRYVAPQAFTRAKAEGGYKLELASRLDPAIVIGAPIRNRPRAAAPCRDGEVTAVSHARSEVTVRWAASGKSGKLTFTAAEAGCPDDKPKNAHKFKQGQKLWLMYDFPVESGPKKCEWAVVTDTMTDAEHGTPWYQVRWVNHSWDDWSKPESTLVQWQQHCVATKQPPGK